MTEDRVETFVVRAGIERQLAEHRNALRTEAGWPEGEDEAIPQRFPLLLIDAPSGLCYCYCAPEPAVK